MKLEHSTTAYRADLVLYGLLALGLAGLLVVGSPPAGRLGLAAWAVAGAASWSLAEYLLHRFVLHGLAPFCRWHAAHHDRPTALIATPTLLSATLFAATAVLPAWLVLGAWPACALGFGLVAGYSVYGLAHHATHHPVPAWACPRGWLARRRRWHALHHAAARSGGPLGHFGVSLALWDRVFGTDGISAASGRRRPR